MKFYRIKPQSDVGKLKKKMDTLLFRILVLKRDKKCEIHNIECSNLGPMHLLSKQTNPRLRYCEENIIIAGWYCSHYYTHQNSEDERAIYAKKRIEEIRGKDYRTNLLIYERMCPTLSITMLNMMYAGMKQKYEELKKEKESV